MLVKKWKKKLPPPIKKHVKLTEDLETLFSGDSLEEASALKGPEAVYINALARDGVELADQGSLSLLWPRHVFYAVNSSSTSLSTCP